MVDQGSLSSTDLCYGGDVMASWCWEIPWAQQRDHISQALKTRTNSPKYGAFCFYSTFIGPAAAKNKGGISRYLANKCSIASWIHCFSEAICIWEEASRISWGAAAFLWDWRDFTKEFGCHEGGSGSQEVVAGITRKLEKQEKKRLKKEKKHLAAISLISSENSSSFSKGCEETSGRPMKKKRQKPQETPQENGIEAPAVSFSKP